MWWKVSMMWLALAAGGFFHTALAAEGEATGRAPAIVERAADPAAEAVERERRITERTERAKREARFNQLDSDGDGYLTEAEVSAEQSLAMDPGSLDRDDDGRISRTEFAAVEILPDDSSR